VQVAQLRFAWLVPGELHQVTTLEEVAQTVLLVACEPIRALEFVEKFLGRAFGGAEAEPFFEVPARGVGDGDDKGFRLGDEREGILQLLLRANVGGQRRDNEDLRGPSVPPAPEQ